MSPVEIEIVRRKLGVIIENLRALEPIRDMTQEEYIGDLYRRKAAERLLQELVEKAIDINTYVIVQAGHIAPSDYYESFLKMGEYKIISLDPASKLAPSAGLRNRLVHEYNQLEHSMVLDAVRIAEELYSKYVKEINDYILKAS